MRSANRFIPNDRHPASLISLPIIYGSGWAMLHAPPVSSPGDIKSLGAVNDIRLRVNSIVFVDASRKIELCNVTVALVE